MTALIYLVTVLVTASLVYTASTASLAVMVIYGVVVVAFVFVGITVAKTREK
jgi:hypothetical protein